MYEIQQLNEMLVPELIDVASQLQIQDIGGLDKEALIQKILLTSKGTVPVEQNGTVVKSKRGRKPGSKKQNIEGGQKSSRLLGHIREKFHWKVFPRLSMRTKNNQSL